MDYSEITITISCAPNGKYNLEAIGADGQVREGTLSLPFELQDLAESVRGVANTVREGSTRKGVTEAGEDITLKDPRSRGIELFNALFQPSIIEGYHQTLFGRRTGQGVRVRLVLGGSDPGMMKVASIPWELLLKDHASSPLALTPDHVLVRSLRAAEPVTLEDIPKPLRIMLVMSNPRGTGALEVARESAAITARWEGVPGTELVQVAPTLNAITSALARKPFHVLHYMGHGDFSQANGEGSLVLEDAQGDRDPVDAATFAARIKGRGLRLIFLNACKSGATSARNTPDPFGGVAAALIAAGVPAVVANQFPISDAAAIEFSNQFYLAIVRGLPVDAAVSEGRRMLFRTMNAEWATPVLYMRSATGEIIRLRQSPTRAHTNEQHKFTVFLAATSRPDGDLRAPLAAALSAAGVEVTGYVPGTDAERDERTHDEQVRTLVSDADLCVHFLDESAGQPLLGVDEPDAAPLAQEPRNELRATAVAPNTVPVRQFVIATQSARSQLLIYEESLELPSIEDAAYRGWFEAQQRRDRDPDHYQIQAISLTRAKATILAVRDAMARAAGATEIPAPGERLTSVYVDVQPSDVRLIAPLFEYLGERGMNVSFGSSRVADDAAPVTRVSALEEELARADILILVFGDGSSESVAERFDWLDKTLAHLDLTTPIVIYTTGAAKTKDDLRFTRRLKCDIVDATTAFDAARMNAVLAAP